MPRIRQTKQREALLQVLEEEGRPLEANEMLRLAQKYVEGLGLATVYRNIQSLIDDQALIRVDYPGQPLRYELPIYEHLPHLICRTCHQVYRLPEPVPDFDYKVPQGYDIQGEEVIFFGTCPECNDGSSR